MTIWKYRLALTDTQTIRMPKEAKILTVQPQMSRRITTDNSPPDEYLQLWAIVDPTALMSDRQISIYGTGHTMPKDPGRYISTVQLQGGSLVLHVFEQE